VAIGVVLVRRDRGDAQANPDDETAEHIEHGLDRIGHQGV